MRVAMGASSWQVVRQMLTESLLISLAGAALGVGFAYGFLQWIKANLLAGIPFWMQFRIDWQVLVFTVGVAVATAFVFGLLPALQASRPNLIETLRDAGARGTVVHAGPSAALAADTQLLDRLLGVGIAEAA